MLRRKQHEPIIERDYSYLKWPKRKRMFIHRSKANVHSWELECGHGLIIQGMRSSRWVLGRNNPGNQHRSHCQACYEEGKRDASTNN